MPWCRTHAAAGALLLAGCAVPATEVQVATMPMRDALERTRIEAKRVLAPAEPVARLAGAMPPVGAPQPLLSSPEVRLAYLYDWVDPEGNRHFGEWVAIPVAGFAWIMDDGSRPPVDGGVRTDGAPPEPR